MRTSVRLKALVTMLAVTGVVSACGTDTPSAMPTQVATPAPSSSAPAPPAADYVGPITTVMHDRDGSATLSPPRPGEHAGVTWQSVCANLCSRPSGTRIMLADVESSGAGGKFHGQLMFIFEAFGQQCPPAFGARSPAPPRHDCHTVAYADAATGHWIASLYGGDPIS